MNPQESPFTPGQTVSTDLFIGREGEITRLTEAIQRAFMRKRPEVVFIAGERGIGKSSLAAMTRELAEAEEGALAAHIPMKRVRSLPDMMRQVFDRLLKDNYRKSWFGKMRDLFGERVHSVGFRGMKVEFNPKSDDLGNFERNFAEVALEVLEEIGEERRGMLLIWDEINGLAQSADFAHWLKGTIDDIGVNRVELPLCLVLIGTEDQRRQLIAHHGSLDRILRVVDLQPWSDGETEDFYRTGFNLAGENRLTAEALKFMVKYTGGLPVFAHEIGSAVWRRAQEDGEIDKAIASLGVFNAAKEIGRSRIAHSVVDALNSKNYRAILSKIPQVLRNDIQFSRRDLTDKLNSQERRGLDNFLQRMCKIGGLLREESGDSGIYRFPTRLEAVYHTISTIESEFEHAGK